MFLILTWLMCAFTIEISIMSIIGGIDDSIKSNPIMHLCFAQICNKESALIAFAALDIFISLLFIIPLT